MSVFSRAHEACWMAEIVHLLQLVVLSLTVRWQSVLAFKVQ